MKRTDYEYLYPLRVRYAECDPQGIVFNANYLTYFDVALTEYFRHRGFDYQALVREENIDFHVIQSLINYKTPARFDEELLIGVQGERTGVRINWQVAIFSEDRLVCSGHLIYVIMDTLNGKPSRRAGEFLETLGV